MTEAGTRRFVLGAAIDSRTRDRPESAGSGGVRPFRFMPQYDAQQIAGLEKGEVLAGKYRVERVLGAGGMGVVVAAHHLDAR